MRLNAGMLLVRGRCGPRHRSVQTRSPVRGVEVVVHGQLRAADLDVGALGCLAGAALEADQLELVRLVRELGLRVGVADLAAGEVLPGADDLGHLLLEGREVLGGEGPLGVEVVVEAVLDRRADAEPGAGEQLLHGLGEHVRGRVPDDRAPVGAGRGDRLDLGVGVRGPVQVLEVTGGDARGRRPRRRGP